jgi:ferredoxin
VAASDEGANDEGRRCLEGAPAACAGNTVSPELRVNPIACEAHGLCAELLPELITADPWGYPIIAPGPVPPDLLPLARRAVAVCPTLALLLTARARPGAS